MKRSCWIVLVAALGSAYGQTPEMKVVNAAAEALGGKDRILSVRTIRVDGYGQQAYQNGGGNPTGSPDAPQKWTNINGMVWTFDLEHHRMRREQRLVQDFVFAYARNMDGDTRVNQVLDGDVAYNVGADGRVVRANDAAARARRIDMLNNPVVIVRAALDSATKLSGLHAMGKVQVMDLTTAEGDKVRFAVDTESHLPAWMSWVGPDNNLGDVTYTTYWTGFAIENGVRLPIGYNTVQDWRNVVWSKLYIDKNSVDVSVDDMSAPAVVRSAPAPAPRSPDVTVTPIAKGVWYLHSLGGSSTAFEFTDHLTLFEAYGNENNAEAIIQKARTLVPGKPVTQVIVSHHHFDHSGGLRAAVAEGLTIITQRGNTGIFEEMAARPAKEFPDALGRNPKPIKIIPVDEKLVLKDSAMEVDIYRVISNNHMPNGIMAYVPGAKVVAEGDLVDEGWDIVWWGDSYNATVKYWNLDVEKDLPVHGNIHTYAEVLALLRSQIKNAQDLCDRAEKSHLTLQGCPVVNTF
jgi:glyoxylase-like metal-dependent hydrolase (beta-lactamase superfamily II)